MTLDVWYRHYMLDDALLGDSPEASFSA